MAEYGIAAHWRYKEGAKRDVRYEERLAWLRQLMDWQREMSQAGRVRGVRQDGHLPGPGLRLHAQGRDQGPAHRQHAARLRLPHPHRPRAPLRRRQGQRQAGLAELPAQERRSRRDRHQQVVQGALARLAERKPGLPAHDARPREDPPVVQAPGARGEHRPRQGDGGEGAGAASARACRGWRRTS